MPRKDPVAAKEYWDVYRKTDGYRERQARWRDEQKAWRQTQAGRDELYDLNLRKRYGISLADYNQMFDAQGGSCAICNRHQTQFKRRLAVDHCHATGIVRGLLCHHCNQALGKMMDDPAVLRRAAIYLETEYERRPPTAPKPKVYRRRSELMA